MRKDSGCNKCGHSWLLESKAVKFVGTKEQLKSWVFSHGRKWGHCYCDNNLYTQ